MLPFSTFYKNLNECFDSIDLLESDDINESFATNKAHAMGLKYMGWGMWGDGQHATHKNEGGNLVALPHSVHADTISQQKLKVTDLAPSMRDAMVKGYNNHAVGEASPIVPVHDKPLKSPSAVRQAIIDGMDKVRDGKAHGVLVTVDGKPVHLIKTPGTQYGRTEYEVHDSEGVEQHQEFKRTSSSAMRRAGYYGHHVTKSTKSKSDTISSATYRAAKAIGLGSTGEDKEAYKAGRIEVHTVHADPNRIAARKERGKNKVNTQTNYTNDPSGATENRYDGTGVRPKRVETSVTNAGDMTDIKHAAVDKFVDQKLGAKEGPRTKSLQLHKELGDMLASGADHRDITRKMAELSGHLQQNGNSNTDIHSDMIKDDLKRTWNRKYGLDRLRAALAK